MLALFSYSKLIWGLCIYTYAHTSRFNKPIVSIENETGYLLNVLEPIEMYVPRVLIDTVAVVLLLTNYETVEQRSPKRQEYFQRAIQWLSWRPGRKGISRLICTYTQTAKWMFVCPLLISNCLTWSFCLMTCFIPSFLGDFCSCFGRCVTSLFLEVKENSFPLVIGSDYVEETSMVFCPKSLTWCLLESWFLQVMWKRGPQAGVSGCPCWFRSRHCLCPLQNIRTQGLNSIQPLYLHQFG